MKSNLRVSFQGEPGAFSEDAAVALLGDAIQLIPRPTFESLFDSVRDGSADMVLAPIENTLAGSVLQVYDLLLGSSLSIVGEVVIPVVHNLIGCAKDGEGVWKGNDELKFVEHVESHPVALAQCTKFFAANPHITRSVSDDTAASVRRIVERGDPTHAAIASARAADVYGGIILRAAIQDHAENYTRFFLLAPDAREDQRSNKLSLALKLAHAPGALHRALEPFARRGIDLLKIESRPVRGQPWEYTFYLDLRGSLNDHEIEAALGELRGRSSEIRILGSYQSAVSQGSALAGGNTK